MNCCVYCEEPLNNLEVNCCFSCYNNPSISGVWE